MTAFKLTYFLQDLNRQSEPIGREVSVIAWSTISGREESRGVVVFKGEKY